MNSWEGSNHILPKFDLKMKFSLLFFIISLFQLQASSGYAQKTKIDLNMRGASVLEIIEAIESKTEFKFFYSKEELDLDRELYLYANKQRIGKVLKKLFPDGSINYRIIDKQIVLTPNGFNKQKEETPPIISTQDPVKVTGKVTDELGNILPGVNVVEKNTANGVVTDFDGNYEIVAQEGAILMFSYVGYTLQEVDISGKTVIDIVLVPDNTELDEVVITAMGLRRDRRTLGYAVSTIKGEELTKAGNPVNPFSILQGRAAGVSVRQSATGPTGGVEINIRGTNALEFEANTRPLFVIDGVPMIDNESSIQASGGDALEKGDYGSGINDLNALDIESIEVLKGAKAAVLYGSAGGNGVVLITTKKGNDNGGLGIDVNYQFSIERPRSYLKLQNEFGSGYNEYTFRDFNNNNDYWMDINGENTLVQAAVPQNFGPAFAGNENVNLLYWDGITRPYQAYPNNFDFIYQDGHTKSTNVAITKGGDFGNMRFSFTNYEYQGMVPDFFQKRNTISFAGRLKVSEKVSIEYSTNYFDIKTQNRIEGFAVGQVNSLNRDAPYEELMANEQYKITDEFLEDGSINPNFGYYYHDDYRDNIDPNFVSEILSNAFYPDMPMARQFYGREADRYVDDKSHLIASIRPTIQITDWLSFTGQASIDLTNTDIENKEKPLLLDPVMLGGEYALSKSKALNHEFRAFMNFDKTFAKDRLRVFAMAGGTFSRQYTDRVYASIYSTPTESGFIYPDFFNLDNQAFTDDIWPDRTSEFERVRGSSVSEKEVHSLLGLATFTWDNVYTLELNARRDWTSTLDPTGGNNSYFYPGVALTWNYTNLAKSLVPAVQFAKLRGSFADIGRDAPSTYFAYQSLNAGSAVNDTDAIRVSAQSSVFGGTIRPERKREWEIGTEMNFFKGNRLSLDFSYYTNNVYDQIMSVGLTPTSGADAIRINAGDVRNWGYELSLNATPIQTEDFRLNMNLTMASQKNVIEKLYPGLPEKLIVGIGHQVEVLAREGERSGNIYAQGPRVVESGEFAGRKIVVTNGTEYALNEVEETLTGNIYPDFLGGLSTNLSYKRFNLGIFLDYSYGATLYNFKDYVLKGTGASVESLAGRNEAYGGLAYYIDEITGEYIPWDHSQSAPAGAEDGLVYHDGIIVDGVQEIIDNTDPLNPIVSYEENDQIVSANDYYTANYIFSTGAEALDGVSNRYDNDYIKIRELSLSYRFPPSVLDKLNLQNLSISLFARNLGYLYKTLPNFDAESSNGTKAFVGNTVLPSAQSFGFQLNLGL